MDTPKASIRELKSRLSHYLRLCKAGESVVVTDRGQPIARIVPIGKPLDERLEALAESGLVEWSGRRLTPGGPVAHARDDKSVSDVVVEDRR